MIHKISCLSVGLLQLADLRLQCDHKVEPVREAEAKDDHNIKNMIFQRNFASIHFNSELFE